MWEKRKKTHFHFAKPSLPYFRLRTQGSLCFATLMIYIDIFLFNCLLCICEYIYSFICLFCLFGLFILSIIHSFIYLILSIHLFLCILKYRNLYFTTKNSVFYSLLIIFIFIYLLNLLTYLNVNVSKL